MVPVERITFERLGRWSKWMSEQHSTPVVLIGMGRGWTLGQVTVCTVGDVDNKTLREMLLYAIAQLED